MTDAEMTEYVREAEAEISALRRRAEKAGAELSARDREDHWLIGGDAGVSSKAIWSVMTGRASSSWERGSTTPRDPDDFGRCYRLLEDFPAWRERMPEVVAAHPEWSGLVAAWDELTSLYLEEAPSGRAPKLEALQ